MQDRKEADTVETQQKDGANTLEPPMFDDDFGPDHVWVDDGTTSFADMDLTRPLHKQRRTQKAGLDLTRKEKRAIMRAAWARYLPPMLCTVLGFSITILLIWLWLS